MFSDTHATIMTVKESCNFHSSIEWPVVHAGGLIALAGYLIMPA